MDVLDVTPDTDTFAGNAFLVLGTRPTLVDTSGHAEVVEEVAAHTDSLDAVVLTHQHWDHANALDAVVERFDPDVYAYADHELRTHAIDDGDSVEMGDETFEVVYTPGHAADHVSLCSETTLFSGDVVVHDDGAFDYGSFGRTDQPGQSRERLIESIRTLLDRLPESVEQMYAGHGDAFHGDVRDVVETALSRAEKREPKYPDE
ncbi:MBL fold metallo-hydrolase [Halorarius halobius]|uniref:MBL fold metallo-hydrolase n=1 Tax=Halorarius halobius TaxID=2962671 RepID=UPI0020CF248F|nr:MBL fold metallo-hydrolase [Halorarius halobius]